MKILNQRLYDELGGSLMYILEYAERNNITLPNKDRLWRMVDNIHETVDIVKNHHDKINRYKFSPTENKHYFSSPTESQQRNKTTDDETEPIFLMV